MGNVTAQRTHITRYVQPQFCSLSHWCSYQYTDSIIGNISNSASRRMLILKLMHHQDGTRKTSTSNFVIVFE